MPAKKPRPEPVPPDLIYVVVFNDGASIITTEAVGQMVASTSPGAKLFTYGIVSELKVARPRRRRTVPSPGIPEEKKK